MTRRSVGVTSGGTRRNRLMKTCAWLTDGYRSLDWSGYFAKCFDSATATGNGPSTMPTPP
jgi:hypothetical protein